MILIDPKKVELTEYGKIPHLMHPVVKDEKKAEAILAWAVDKMEERYERLRRARVRNIAATTNCRCEEIVRRVNPDSEEERATIPRQMPYIVIVIDEVGDLMMKMKKEVEGHIIRLAQKSRAAGIHLILATQKPTVDVITGLIKSNLPARICFQVASRSDSRVVLDEKGAREAARQGRHAVPAAGHEHDHPGAGRVRRDRGDRAGRERHRDRHAELRQRTAEPEDARPDGAGGGRRDRREAARPRPAVRAGDRDRHPRAARQHVAACSGRSASATAGRRGFIDFMAEDGIVGAYNGSNAREVLVTPEEWEARKKAVG